MLTPFFIAMLLAYFCSPLVDKLCSLGINRDISSAIVIAGVFIFLGLFFVVALPLFYEQIVWISHAASNHKEDLNKFISSFKHNQYLNPTILASIENSFTEISSSIFNVSSNIILKILQSSMAAVNMVMILFITPVAFYYFLANWEHIVATIDSLIPRKAYGEYSYLKTEIDAALSNYVRGQFFVCTIMGIFYAIGLSLVGVKSWLALGFISGSLTFIPYVGAFFSITLSMLVAAVQFLAIPPVLAVLFVYLLGQMIEAYVVTPKFLGRSLELNPMWIIFGLLAGNAALGFVGMLIALPLTATIAVIIKYLIKHYKNSSIYN
jgi:predicted PurR-regulated permease PerM